jgi:hypothetical protein
MYVDCTTIHFMTVNATLCLAADFVSSIHRMPRAITLSASLNPVPHLIAASCEIGSAELVTNRQTILGIGHG